MPGEVIPSSGKGDGAENWLKNFVNDLAKASTAKQITVGGVSGWLAGYMSVKVGKVAAVSVGGSLLLIQLASHQGYIKVNWSKVNKQMEKAKKEIEKEAQKKLPRVLDEVQRFIQDNAVLAAGFAGGFLLGIASS